MIPISALVRRQWIRQQGRLDVVVRYLTGQGMLQVLNGLTGLLLLRWLSIDEQAKFSLAMALLATLSLLSDLGLGGSLLGLIGNRLDDQTLVGQYIRAIRQTKNYLLLLGALVGGGLALVYGRRHGWQADAAALFGLLLLCVYAQSESGYYAALLQAHRRLAGFYRPQLVTAVVRLLLSTLLCHWVGLTALLAVGLATVAFVINACWLQRLAAAYYTPTRQVPAPVQRQVTNVLLPMAPMVGYYALQGQLTSFLAGLYGQSETMAGLGALGRLAQLFALLNPFSTVVLLPYLARSSARQLPVRYVTCCAGGLLIAAPIVVIGYLDPRPFLWLLGGTFRALRPEIGLYLLTAALWYLTGMLWAANVARRWNVWYTSLAYVGLTLTTQLLGIRHLDLSTVHDLVRLNFFMACSTLVAYLFTAVVGHLNHTHRCAWLS